MSRVPRTARITAACLVTVALTSAPARAGRDIVRILSPDSSASIISTPPPDPPKTSNLPAPKTPRAPANTQPSEKLAGKFLKLPVRLGTLATDNSRPWLGVNLDNDAIDRAFAISIGLMNPAGSLITETTPGGPAASSGLRAGDIAVGVEGSAVANSDQFRQALGRNPPGAVVNVEVWRFVPEGSDFVGTLRGIGDGGNAAIMAMLGQMFANGKGVPRNDAEAVNWFRKAATSGHPASMSDYAMMMAEGRGTAKNDSEALRWYRAGADTSNTYAMWRYAVVLFEGKITAKDTTQAAQYFQRAAEGGFSPAMYDFAVMHHNGLGMPRNYQAAARWYQKAIELNNSAAMVNLGLLYDEGKGVEQSDANAIDLYRRAANLGHPSGMQNLGVMLDNGRGVPQRDPEQAADLILKSVSLHNEFSYKQLTSNHAAYTREFRMAVQRRLQAAGHYNGPIDSDFGQSTQAAITAYFNRRQ